MHFKYRGLSKTGEYVKSTIIADSLDIAKGTLKASGVIVEEIKEADAPLFDFNIKRKIKIALLADISRDISLYIKSGVSLNRALYLIGENYKNERRNSKFFTEILTFLDEGKGFYDALVEQKVYSLPSFFMLSIKASENLGVMDRVLEDMSRYLKEQDALKRESSLAMIYPMFILITSFGVLAFLLGFVVPTIVSVYDGLGKELPTITQIIISASEFVQSYYHIVLGVLVIAIISFGYSYKQSYRFRYMIDNLLLTTPLVKKFIEYIELARFSNLASILSSSGISTAEVLQLCSDVPDNSVFKELFHDATIKVIEGEKLSLALSKQKRFVMDNAFIKALALSEETSTFSLMMSNLSIMYGGKAKDFSRTLTAMLEPMMMLFVGGLVGFIVAGMLLPIFSLNIG
jgi:type IV pilus assembly protein PilC